jgi:iron complex transport system permease protein
MSISPADVLREPLGDPRRRQAWQLIACSVVALAIAMTASSGVGAILITPSATLHAIAQGLIGHGSQLQGDQAIVWTLRLPRVLMAALVGGSLGLSGAAMQGLFRNPLADPYLLGVASGGSFGATVVMTLAGHLASAFAEIPFLASDLSYAVPAGAFVGAVFAVTVTVLVAHTRRAADSASLLLSGIVIGSVLTAGTTYLMIRDADRLRAVMAWSLGNLSSASWQALALSAPYAAVGMLILCSLARGLDALQLGDDTAKTLGIDDRKLRWGVVVGTSLATSAAVSFVGMIGFVGLMAPHIMRRLGAPTHAMLLPSSALGGATILVLADLGARWVIRPAELPVGIVTTLLGGPFFLWLLRRAR